MNPSPLFTAFVIACTIGPLAALLSLLARDRLATHREKTAAAIANARRAGFLQGMHLGYAAWGIHVKTLHGMNVHGFAEECRGCGTATGSILAADAEYWTCQSCQHRNPAPMPVTPKPPPRAPANHE